MFTGIISAIGRITMTTPIAGGVRFAIDSGSLGLNDIEIGASIAVNGCCLTATVIEGNSFLVDVSEETLRCTAPLVPGMEVNLEKALRFSDRLDGHLVAGHVDGVGQVIRFESIGENRLLQIQAPGALAKYIARKGSITVNGVSLTVNQVIDNKFEVNLIPHTLKATTLQYFNMDSIVNLEVDLIARYVERMLSTSQGG